MKLKTNCKPLQMGSPQVQTDKNSPVSREFRGYGSPFFCFWWWAWGVYTGREGFVLFFFFFGIFLHPFIGLNKTRVSSALYWELVNLQIRLSLEWRGRSSSLDVQTGPISPRRPRSLQLFLASWSVCCPSWVCPPDTPSHSSTQKPPANPQWPSEWIRRGEMEM